MNEENKSNLDEEFKILLSQLQRQRRECETNIKYLSDLELRAKSDPTARKRLVEIERKFLERGSDGLNLVERTVSYQRDLRDVQKRILQARSGKISDTYPIGSSSIVQSDTARVDALPVSNPKTFI